MTLVKKITKDNFLPETGLGRVPAYADKFNYLVDLIFGTDLTVGKHYIETIVEATPDAGVTIDGVLLKDGTITVTSPIIQSVDAAITALGTDDTDGYALTKQFNVITGGGANTGVELPLAQAGQTVIVANLTASAKKVYANASDQIDDKTATTGFVTLQPEQVIVFRSYTAALWQSDYEAEGVYDVLYVDTIAENTAGTGVTVDGVLLKDSQVTTDTINEKTGGAGVTIDSVLLKDNTVLVGAGTVGAPSVKVGAADTGLYQVSGTQTGFSQDGTLKGGFDSNGLFTGTLTEQVVGAGIDTSGLKPYWIAIKGPQVAETAATGGAMTAAQLLTGYIDITGATGNVALPTAANITTAFGTVAKGTIFEFTVNAVGMTAANIVTFTLGAGVTAMSAPALTGGGLLTVTQDTQVVGRFQLIAVDAGVNYKIIRIA